MPRDMSLNVSGIEKLGLIAGGTSYPLLLAKEAKRRGVKVYAVGTRGLSPEEIERYVEKMKWIELGAISELIDFFREQKLKYAIMAGNVDKKKIFESLKLDPLAIKIFQQAKDKSDMNLLDMFAGELRRYGIELLDCRTFLEKFIPKKGNLSKTLPTSRQWQDVLFGWKVAKVLSSFDIGMTVVVKDRVVISLEAIEGTDSAIRRAAEFIKEDFVVVKVARPHQDLRFELPVVGLDTVRLLVNVRASVLAIEAEKTLFFNMEEALELANRKGLSIVAI